jgi:hypothetical protein
MARFRPLTTEIAAPTTSGTASAVSAANVVRAYHSGSGAAVLVTLINPDATVVGTFSLAAGDTVYIDKSKTQKVFASAADVKLTSVTYPI